MSYFIQFLILEPRILPRAEGDGYFRFESQRYENSRMAEGRPQVQFSIGPRGQMGSDDNRRYERRYIERRSYGDRLTTGTVGGCRTVVIREEDQDGDIVNRRVRCCR